MILNWAILVASLLIAVGWLYGKKNGTNTKNVLYFIMAILVFCISLASITMHVTYNEMITIIENLFR